ncbi:glutaredoxin 2, C-terminal domain protein [Halobacteriovorax sp. BALOs_7]|uniref:glutaredoxin 2 n=1 Tax=Halobacteriovorax sp. BALOs_7 TaxID=2109558 RepID=UPI000EA26EBD|nr:glutaredoxin 2 [Halobacteriovorax sp. BALOs_7]AYF45236.1 glutaredoxin 2, C-terminal domain protein [Halobacteriovorax sp. BALOs_7]
MKLYHYIHCPFCVRVRMALGFFDLDYESVVLDYNDEETPLKLTNKKMLPIMEIDGEIMNESLDIIKALAQKSEKDLHLDKLDTESYEQLEQYLDALGKDVHNLCMPYWAWSKEFTPEAREYFINKKSAKRGPFNTLAQNKQLFLKGLELNLGQLPSKLLPFYESDKFTILDILLASHIWGMYIFPEYQFPPQIHIYLQKVKELTNFNYHDDFWK